MKNVCFPIRKNILPAAVWLLAVAAGILLAVSGSTAAAIAAGVLSFAFIGMLIWKLARAQPRAEELPEPDFRLLPLSSFTALLLILLGATGLVFFTGMVVGTSVGVMGWLALLALLLLLRWRNSLTLPLTGWGLLAGLLCGAGIRWLGNGDTTWALFNVITLPPIFITGAFLMERSGLGTCHVLRANYAAAGRGLLLGCVLAAPATVLNLLGSVQAGDTWVQNWWQPLYAWVPAIAEETWARLFLTTLCYALLRPASRQRPRRAVAIAVMVGALVHSFTHSGFDVFGLVIGGLLYGLPPALLMIKEDFESAVGYHFLIDFGRFIAAWMISGA